MQRGILLFADRLPPMTGGVEMHARYFIEHFSGHSLFPLLGVVSKNTEKQDCLITPTGNRPVALQDLPELFDPAFVFFNSGRWIEELSQIRNLFPNAAFFYRTGGNEILQAALIRQQVFDHALRQAYWAENLNSAIDVLITNSAYTERRLRGIGVTCRFERCVGGVNVAELARKPLQPASDGIITIFCAARFVPYKNHSLLLSVIHQLILRGYNLRLRLAGDGPLLQQAKKQVEQANLNASVQFLSILDNEEVCRETAQANVYMQLSTDQVTEVVGGSYIHSEGMGRSILEAVTAGTFVIAGRSGALDEIVTADRGLLIELDCLEEIINKTEQVLKNLKDRKTLTEAYSWRNIFKRYEDLLGELDESPISH